MLREALSFFHGNQEISPTGKDLGFITMPGQVIQGLIE
jgi:hypothetical protein